MTQKYPGGFVTLTPPTLDPALGAATQGIWTLDQALTAAKLRSWPMYDPYYNNVVLNLHGDGTNGAQNNTFLDSSTNNFTITRNGNTTQGTFSPYGQGWSNYFNGSSDYLTIADNTAFNFGTGDGTVEFWFYSQGTSNNYPGIVGSVNYNTSGSASIRFDNTGYKGKVFMYVNGGGDPVITSTSTIAYNTWTHIAITRSGTALKMYVNGVLDTTVTISAALGLYFSYGGLRIGRGFDVDTTNAYFPGYVSNLRLVKGSVVYTASFTPPSAPLTAITNTSLLTSQSNRFIDSSSNAFAITASGTPQVQKFQPFNFPTSYTPSTIGGSGYFDGTGDYLSVPYSTSAFDWWTGDYTIEAWVYTSNITSWSYTSGASQFPTLLGNCDPAGTTNYWCFGIDGTNGSVTFRYYSGSSNAVSTSVSLIKGNAWNHIMMTKTSSGISVGVNGTATSPTAIVGTPQSSASYPLSFGRGNNTDIFGYVGGLRIVKGTAIYSGTTYTVPTAPLTAVANTSLLTSMTNAGIYDNAMMNDLETVGNAQISTSVKKYGTGSMYFDGTTTNRIKPPASNNFAFGTGNFTVEAWIYITNLTTENFVFDTRSGVSTSGMGFSIEPSTGKLRYSGSANNVLTSTAVSANTWAHVAWVRNGSTLTGYINGVSGGTASNSDNLTMTNGEVGNVPFATTVGTNMYIDDLRITKGVARYVANFTPPTSQLQDQ